MSFRAEARNLKTETLPPIFIGVRATNGKGLRVTMQKETGIRDRISMNQKYIGKASYFYDVFFHATTV